MSDELADIGQEMVESNQGERFFGLQVAYLTVPFVRRAVDAARERAEREAMLRTPILRTQGGITTYSSEHRLQRDWRWLWLRKRWVLVYEAGERYDEAGERRE